jgi:hypothetical protein
LAARNAAPEEEREPENTRTDVATNEGITVRVCLTEPEGCPWLNTAYFFSQTRSSSTDLPSLPTPVMVFVMVLLSDGTTISNFPTPFPSLLKIVRRLYASIVCETVVSRPGGTRQLDPPNWPVFVKRSFRFQENRCITACDPHFYRRGLLACNFG